MAKKKKEQASVTSTVVSDWKQQNEEKLQDIEKTNPALFSGIIQALNYLSGSLGGSAIVQEKNRIEIPDEKPPKQVLTNELLDGTFIRVRDFNQFLLVQGITMKLGYEYHPILLPVPWQPNDVEAKYSIKSVSDLDAWIKQKNIEVRDGAVIGVMFQQSNDGLYTIQIMFAADEILLDETEFRELNLLDLGLEQSVIDSMSLEETKTWIRAFPEIHREFQRFAVSKGFNFRDVTPYDDERGYVLHKDDGTFYFDYEDSDGDAYIWQQETPISPKQFNVKVSWLLEDFKNTKCAILNSKRDLPQLRHFFENIKTRSGEPPKVYADSEIDSWCYVTVNEKAEVYFVKWDSSVDFSELNRKKFRIGDLGLPLIAEEKYTKGEFPSLYDKVKLPTTFKGAPYDHIQGVAGKARNLEVNVKANDFGVDCAYVVKVNKIVSQTEFTDSTSYSVAVFTNRNVQFFDKTKYELEAGMITLAEFNKLIRPLLNYSEGAYDFDKIDLEPYETSSEVEIGMNIPAESEKNVSLEDQKSEGNDGTEDLEDELDNLEI